MHQRLRPEPSLLPAPLDALLTKAVSAASAAASLVTGETSRPRVALIAPTLVLDLSSTAPETADPVRHHIEALAGKLAQLGFRVDVWIGGGAGEVREERWHGDVWVIRLPHKGTSAAWVLQVRRLAEARGWRYEFLNSHLAAGERAARELADRWDVAHVHTPHAETELAGNPVLETDPLSAPAQSPGYDDDRFFPVGSGLRTQLRARLGFHGKVILALTDSTAAADFGALLEAFAVAARREPEATLLIGQIHPAATETALQELIARSGCADRIRCCAPVTAAERADLYRSADLFIVRNDDATARRHAFEAMACGLPTVLPTSGTLHELFTFGRHALFADPLDALDFGITMTKVLRHVRLRMRLARMGAHHVKSFFTWSAVAHALVLRGCPPSLDDEADEVLASA